MKQVLLFFLFICFSFFVNAQVQGPPPPCGITPVYVCDDNNDGFEELNLRELFPFSSFCAANQGEVESDYHAISYYETQDDMINQINAIANPESYTNISNPQIIYFRANAINPGGTFEFLSSSDDFVEIKRVLTNSPELVVYDAGSGGLSTFDLTSANIFCGSNDKNDYTLTYHVSESDADAGTNSIVNPSAFSNTGNPQIIYVRAVHNTSAYVVTTSFKIRVWFTQANNPGDIYICDEDYDGLIEYNLTSLNAAILGNQSSDNFSVSYYLSQADAEASENQLPEFYIISNSEIIYARVDESIGGTYSITSFSFLIFIPPLVSPLEPYEICDDESGDGVEVFDLNTIINQINSGGTVYDISFYTEEGDEYGSGIEGNYTNITNPQTIYVDVEDMEGFGCFTILELQLTVQDCSTKGVIKVNAFYDANGDTVFDNEEINFLNGALTYEKNNNGVQHVLYSSNGIFNIISDDENNTYDISYNIFTEYDACYDITTVSYDDISVLNGSTANYDFPITKVQECGDIAVYLASYAPPRPGFDYYNRLIIKNKGLETVSSGTIEFVHDPLVTFNGVTNFNSGYSVNNTASGFTLDFVDLKPNEQQAVTVSMNVPIPTSLGTLLTNTATFSVTDLSTENNTSILSETVIGSYDPNDIAESHGPEILYDEFGNNDYLYYTVRFQNVGTADAINVSIDNALNAKLDKSTIQMLSASHNYVFTRIDSQLNWKFDNIHLPSEDMDEPNSHGYVYYKIKPLAGYRVGDIISNTAEIYFDFNPAVITNTFNTEFTTTLSNKKFSKFNVSISPNPATDIVELKFDKNISDKINVSIYNIQGKLILNSIKALQGNIAQINVSSLKRGMYFLKINNNINDVTQKLIVK
ncbi:T9SS type A sorting domain-containing protein [Flavivirga rizhaonensis]|uniref:T9SS type A sorting domain-containing protein n=1 Tax=Flavivirga rizhaonensis TaxID=2559571 RepID=A0A4S1E121_9FLAO|nr:T9SS type A sorting domain-containing protein [Flavivirga rizhaonensis]TGV04286.1 T9SS type A sorting domain-containing protein [Flavivirga rizhaonensis]